MGMRDPLDTQQHVGHMCASDAIVAMQIEQGQHARMWPEQVPRPIMMAQQPGMQRLGRGD